MKSKKLMLSPFVYVGLIFIVTSALAVPLINYVSQQIGSGTTVMTFSPP